MQDDYLNKFPTSVIFIPDREKEPRYEWQCLGKVSWLLHILPLTEIVEL